MVPALSGQGTRRARSSTTASRRISPRRSATIRTNVLFSSAEEGGRSIVVTSTGPGEGKTVVASNLAMALAQAGQRVLLIDADMRKPRVHSHVRHRARSPGCRTCWSATRRRARPCGRRRVAEPLGAPGRHASAEPGGAARRRSGSRTSSRRSTQHFDWVIIDSPPVMAVTDACVVAHLADGVLFVVGSEMTSRQAARARTRTARAREGAAHRRRAQPRRPQAQRVLLLAVLSPRIRRLLWRNRGLVLV